MSIYIEDYVPVVKHNGLNTAKNGTNSGITSFTGANTHTGIETHTGAETHTGIETHTGAETHTGLESFGPFNYKKQVTDTDGAFATAVVLTTAQSGRVILVDDAAGLDFTLPAIGASDIGTTFKFYVTVTITSNSLRITAATGDLLFGAIWMADYNTANTGTYFAADGSDDLIITMNGTTTGGVKGTWLEITATSATQWIVQGVVFGDGTLATPFS